MKRINKLYGGILFLLISSFSYADDFELENVIDDYIGTYIPVQYDNILKSTKSHYDAMLSNRSQYHDILLLNENICYSNLNFHDGYAIPRTVFEQFNFITNENGTFILDNNGNSYRKISENIGSYGYVDFDAYVLGVIFEDAQAFNYVTLDNDIVIINNIEYSIILDSVLFETEGVSVWLRGDRRLYALKIDEISAKLFESNREEISSLVSKNYIIEFPLFFWNDDSYPYINIGGMTQDSLRYIRNLIYAKHGYVFRSEELRKLYEGFSWYQRNLSFSEEDFSNDEQKLLERILRRENR